MRTVWRGLVRIVFWSFERGTVPYDVAVAVIVLFVLLSPRSWFDDRPSPAEIATATVVPASVELHGKDPIDGATVYRVDARLVIKDGPDLEKQLHEAVRKRAKQPPRDSDFEILRIASVRGPDGTISFYDVCVKP